MFQSPTQKAPKTILVSENIFKGSKSMTSSYVVTSSSAINPKTLMSFVEKVDNNASKDVKIDKRTGQIGQSVHPQRPFKKIAKPLVNKKTESAKEMKHIELVGIRLEDKKLQSEEFVAERAENFDLEEEFEEELEDIAPVTYFLNI